MYLTPKKDNKNFSNLFTDDFVQAENIAKYPFAEALGNNIGNLSFSVPGIMTLPVLFVPGWSESKDSGVNQAAKAMYNYVYQGFTSSVSNVEPADLMMYQLAVAHLVCALREGARCYGVLKKFSPYNKYLAERLVQTLGFDYKDWSSNLANFRAEYNIRVQQITQALKIMPDFKLLARWDQLISNIYADGTEEKFQIYAHVIKEHGQFMPTALTTGGSLQYLFWYSTNKSTTVEGFFARIDEMKNALIGDSDINNIAGAILRVYGEKGVAHIPELAENYEVSILYNPAMLKCIHNTRIFPTIRFVDSSKAVTAYGVFQEEGVIKCLPTSTVESNPDTPGVADSWKVYASNIILDFPYEKPTPNEVIEALASCPGYLGPISEEADGPVTRYMLSIVPAAEIVTNAYVWRLDGTALTISTQIVDGYPTGAEIADLTKFDWHHLVPLFSAGGGVMNVFGDLCNYTVISGTTVAKQHDREVFALCNATENIKSVTK